ncbi:hypothetical protein PK28_04770 [Hymenobacter sp. DG25B]|uniref:hypothetical protein n=1 Tax=Hymenobacter sp. DG25B TaxID=1385664 RepID=UPI0005410A4E|nr:hypothetical protein [Hymenobacter sp. DG25B]AIZ63175.1 hypothetical protein PK28_04770 [Hymenobacter sp. DG25B]
MNNVHTFSAETEETLWQQVAADIRQEEGLLAYNAELIQNGYHMQLDVDIDLGGGFEGGYESTTLTAQVPNHTPLRFALHEQDWVHEIGKLLGLTDVELGDPELDAAFIITTNDADALRRLLLTDPAVRQTLLRYQELRLTLAPASHDADAEANLTFFKETALVEPEQLREVYHLLYTLLRQLSPSATL